MKPTEKEIMSAVGQLQEAMLESLEATQAEEQIMLRKQKAQKSLSLARDAVREINYRY